MGKKYDKLSATRKNYEDFVKKIVSGLKAMDYDGLSLIGHGSFFRDGTYIPGVSDIDAIMVLPDAQVLTDKHKLHDISHLIADALRGNPVEFQLSPVDCTIIRDGRFATYGASWDYHKKNYLSFDEVILLVGPDYRQEITCPESVPPEQGTIGHNLSKARKAFLLAEHRQEYDYPRFFEDFMKTIRAASSSSKQLYFLATNKFAPERFSGIQTLEEILPGLNIEPLRRIKKTYSDVRQLKMMRKNPEILMRFWKYTLTFFEYMVGKFIQTYPLQ
jgi:hypothetical protein